MGTGNGMYKTTTRAIQVTVTPKYVPDRSEPAEGRYFWSYTIEILNLGAEVVQLRSRAWHITDANGKVQEVRGPGVVGKQPVLKPGESFEYTSGCPLPTPSGIMTGTYEMQTDGGDTFPVDIPPFSLDMPNATRVLN